MVGKSAGYTADYAKQRIAYLVTASNQSYIDSNKRNIRRNICLRGSQI